jgi:hypothetical protein
MSQGSMNGFLENGHVLYSPFDAFITIAKNKPKPFPISMLFLEEARSCERARSALKSDWDDG